MYNILTINYETVLLIGILVLLLGYFWFFLLLAYNNKKL